MMWFFAILVVLLLGAIAVVASGRGEPLAPVFDDRPDALVPAEGEITAEDLRRVRFSLAFRGYRMSEVDALLDRLAAEKESAATPAEPGHGNLGPIGTGQGDTGPSDGGQGNTGLSGGDVRTD